MWQWLKAEEAGQSLSRRVLIRKVLDALIVWWQHYKALPKHTVHRASNASRQFSKEQESLLSYIMLSMVFAKIHVPVQAAGSAAAND